MQLAHRQPHMHVQTDSDPFAKYRAARPEASSGTIQHLSHEELPPYALLMGFGKRLRDARKAAGLSGDALGQRVGVSKQLVSHWEHERYPPDLNQLLLILKETRITADFLLLGADHGLSVEALRLAREFDSLPQDRREMFHALLTVATSGAPFPVDPSARLGLSSSAPDEHSPTPVPTAAPRRSSAAAHASPSSKSGDTGSPRKQAKRP
jgi:transcriptional regulator with XRE-family HTH domain